MDDGIWKLETWTSTDRGGYLLAPDQLAGEYVWAVGKLELGDIRAWMDGKDPITPFGHPRAGDWRRGAVAAGPTGALAASGQQSVQYDPCRTLQ